MDLRVDFRKRTELRIVRTFSHRPVGSDDIVVVKRGHDPGLDELRLNDAAITRNVFIVILNLVALERETSIVAAIVAGDVIVLDAEDIEGKTKTQIFVAVEGQTAGL